jgi:hypothetical protein
MEPPGVKTVIFENDLQIICETNNYLPFISSFVNLIKGFVLCPGTKPGGCDWGVLKPLLRIGWPIYGWFSPRSEPVPLSGLDES